MPRAPWDPPEPGAAPPPAPPPAPASDLIAPNPSPGFSRGADTRYWPGMDSVIPGYYGGKTLVVSHAHLWHRGDLPGESFMAYCGIAQTVEPALITDPDVPRCPWCAQCPKDRRRPTRP